MSRSGAVGVFGAAGLLMVLVACAPTENRAPKLTEVSTGYLTAGDLARLADAVPPPPLPASEADLADKATSARYRAFEDSDRWLLATSHAELRPPLALQHFDCALGVRFGSAETPNLDRLAEGGSATGEEARSRSIRGRQTKSYRSARHQSRNDRWRRCPRFR